MGRLFSEFFGAVFSQENFEKTSAQMMDEFHRLKSVSQTSAISFSCDAKPQPQARPIKLRVHIYFNSNLQDTFYAHSRTNGQSRIYTFAYSDISYPSIVIPFSRDNRQTNLLFSEICSFLNINKRPYKLTKLYITHGATSKIENIRNYN